MDELEKLNKAKTYIDKLANGINPIDNTTVPENDVINNLKLSRCLFYVSDVLRQVIENNGHVSNKKAKKVPFCITQNEINSYPFSTTPISVSEITERINSLVDLDTVKKLKTTNITNWLVEIGFLEEYIGINEKKRKRPTQQGSENGIISEERTGMYSSYTVVLYTREAQQFILDNMDSIIKSDNNK